MIFFLKTQGGWKENNQLEIEMKKEKKIAYPGGVVWR